MDADIKKWQQELIEEREYKDEFFKKGAQSPLPFKDRSIFQGLAYYPPNKDYRFELDITEHTKKETLQIEDTKGNIRDFMRFGEFRFPINGEEYSLQAYKSSGDDGQLFIPFKDATAGKETYGAGRYLDLAFDRDMMSEGTWALDFNKAYNPWCAYSVEYACPYTPRENVIDVEIPAGEKNYPLAD